MKASKILLITQVVFMYIAMAMFVVIMALALASPETDTYGDAIKGLLIGKFALGFVPFNISLVSTIIALVMIFKEPKSTTKVSMTVKLVLIPWYILNFVEWFLLGIGTLNPLLFMLGIILILWGMVSTYVCMLGTSVYNISYILSLLRRNKCQNKGLMILALVFHFVFVFESLLF